jgi:hypothetical protein
MTAPPGPWRPWRLWQPWQPLIGKIVLTLWLPATIVVGVYMLAGHLTSLPAPNLNDRQITDGLGALFPSAAGSARVVHVLYERCGCSSRVAEELLTRKPLAQSHEAVVMVYDDEKTIDRERIQRLLSAGFLVATLSIKDAAERLHVVAVPLLLVVDGQGRVRYAGGYTARRESPRLEDARIVAEVGAGRSPPPLPVFGCAVAAELQKTLDPLGLKY